MRERAALAAIVAAALLLAWLIRWGCDDAFISYVYARNLVYGDGLTWFGEAVEGYTNFGWVLYNAVGIALGVAPLVWSWAGSLAALALTLVCAYQLALVRTSSKVVGLCLLGLLATNFTFLAYGTSGLETMAQCALLTATWLQTERIRRDTAAGVRSLALLSVLAALAMWTRLDSAVYLLVLAVAAAAHLTRSRAPLTHWLAAIAPALVLVGGWLVWKLVYYGELLPNTFHAKVVVSTATIGWASKLTWWFVREYGLYLPLVAVAIVAVARRRFTARLPLALVVVWLAYVLYAGGDFMEFRFYVPILPPLFVVIAETLAAAGAPRGLQPWMRSVAVVAILAIFSVRHARTYDGTPDNGNDSIEKLATFYGVLPDHRWERLGTPLGDVLHDTGAVLACNGAGAIPYYADLPTIDQLGLNDRWIARHGRRPPPHYLRPGHQRFATAEYLAERNVNFVIGTPRLVEQGILTDIGMTRGIAGWVDGLLGPTPLELEELVVVGVPVGRRRSMLLWYRQMTPAITERIRAAGWEMRSFVRTDKPQRLRM